MAKLVSAKCPDCGARLNVDPLLPQAKCDYCGNVSQVHQGRRPKQESAQKPAGAPQVRAIYVHTPSVAGRLISALVTFAVLGVVGFIVSRQFAGARAVSDLGEMLSELSTSPLNKGLTIRGGAPGEHLQWDGNHQPILLDITSDGVADPVGWVRLLKGSESLCHLAGFNAVSGAQVWMSPALADVSHIHQTPAALVADKLLVADPLGTLRAFSPTNGQVFWSTQLGERALNICGVNSGWAQIELSGERLVNVALASGATSPAGSRGANAPCENAWSLKPGSTPWSRKMADSGPFRAALPDIDGMRVGYALFDPGTSRSIAIGTATPGSGFPIAAAYALGQAERPTKKKRHDKIKPTVLWKSGISAQNPLALAERVPAASCLAHGRLFAAYAMSASEQGQRIASIDASTGRVLWDVPIPKTDSSEAAAVVASDRQVFVSIWTYLHVFDLADGRYRMTIGQW